MKDKNLSQTESISDVIKEVDCQYTLGIDFYGVSIGFKVDDQNLFSSLNSVLPRGYIEIDFELITDYFILLNNQTESINGFYWVENGKPELAFKFDSMADELWVGIEQKILFTLAMISPPKMFYFHAGAVSIGGQGLIIPGKTHSGKTSLIKEFIQNGAEYYSDDCALIDGNGFLYPYPIALGVRSENDRVYLEPKTLNVKIGIKPIKIRYILFTKFEPAAVFNPRIINSGQNAFRLLEHLFYPAGMNRKPQETMEIVAKLNNQTEIIGSSRNEAADVVKWFLNFIKVPV